MPSEVLAVCSSVNRIQASPAPQTAGRRTSHRAIIRRARGWRRGRAQSSFSFASELRECRPRGACSLSKTDPKPLTFDDVEDFTLELSPTGRDHRAEMRSTRGDVGVTQTAPVVERIEREVANVDVELAGQARATSIELATSRRLVLVCGVLPGESHYRSKYR